MKCLVILVLFVASFFAVNPAFGIWLPQSSEELLEESQVIVIGNIMSVTELELEQPTYNEDYPLILEEYTITVEEFVKNPQDAKTMTVRQPTLSTPGRLLPFEGFEVGDRILFYIKSFDGINTYSKESFLIPKQCDTSSVIHKPRIIGSDYTVMQNGIEKKDNFTANHPIQFTAKRDMGTLFGAGLEYDVFISKQVGTTYKDIVLNQTITADSQPCEWLSVAEWEFTPDAGNYLLNGRIYKVMSNFSISNQFFSVLAEPPLKQIKSGVALVDVQCSDDKVPIYKYNRMRVACVSEETQNELWNRGWATMRFHTEDETSSHALCNNYAGEWHPEYEGCRNVTDLQCSLMGGEFVNDLLTCYNEICPADKTYTLCVTNLDLVDENRRIEIGPANDPKDSFPEKYDAVIEGSIQICMGHKGYPQRSQCVIEVNSYLKFDGQRTEQFTALVYDATLIPEPNTKAVFGLKYHPDENYYEIVETGFSRK